MAIALLIATVICWGVPPILEKIGLAKNDPIVGATIRSIVSTAGLLIITFLQGKGRALIEIDGKSFLLFGSSALLAGILGMWTYFAVLRMEATSKVVPIAASYPLVTVLLSFIILREGLTLPRIAGTFLIVTGSWLVK